MPLLINEPSLQIDREVAKRIGINEALVLQRMHELLVDSKELRDGVQWLSRSYREWHADFPFWSIDTIIRSIRKLEDAEYVRSSRGRQKEKSYRIDYEVCEKAKIVLFLL